jgi:hypothetical protein
MKLDRDPPVYEKQPELPVYPQGSLQQYPQQGSPLGMQPQYPQYPPQQYPPQQYPPQQYPPQQYVPQPQAIPGQFYVVNGQTCVFTAGGIYVPIQQQQQQQQQQRPIEAKPPSNIGQFFQSDADRFRRLLGFEPWKAFLGFGIFSIIFIGLFFGLFFGLVASQ